MKENIAFCLSELQEGTDMEDMKRQTRLFFLKIVALEENILRWLKKFRTKSNLGFRGIKTLKQGLDNL
jgi:hypothetical protein